MNAVGLAGCGGSADTGDEGPIHFSDSSSQVYEIQSLGARLDQLDERVSLGSIADVLVTASGYFISDGLNQRIVLLDRNLDPVRVIGRQGEGPGEFRFPRRLAHAGDQVLVLDIGAGRVSYLTLDGDFVRSQRFPGNANDIANHPELGLLVAGDAFPDHYLARVTVDGDSAFGRIPDELKVDHGDVFQLPLDLVTVTDDGLTHVLDADQLAVASFGPDGELVRVAFLPADLRVQKMREARERIEAFGGPERVLGVAMVVALEPLEDARLFVRMTSEGSNGRITKGLVLDLERLEAIPLVVPASRHGWRWMRGSGVYFDGMHRLVMSRGSGDAGLVTAQVKLTAEER